MFQTDDLVRLRDTGVSAAASIYLLRNFRYCTLLVEDASPFVLEALLNTLVMEDRTSVRLSNAFVFGNWFDSYSDSAIVCTVLANLIHCTDILFINDTSPRMSPLAESRTGTRSM